jgi:transposase
MTQDLPIVNRRCAGIDVHKDFVTVSARVMIKRKVEYLDARFDTTTRGLLALAAWLEQNRVEHALMEATGVYWKPVWHILDGALQLTLANAHDVRNLPGRKSDVGDARWLCTLATYGLVRASFVPPAPIRDLRDLTRTRHQLVRQVVQNENRVAKILEDANIKLGSVVSDLFGVSGRRILDAMVAGETDPVRLASLADRRLKAKPSELVAALEGRFSRHHAFLVGAHLVLIDQLDVAIANFERRVDELLAPFRPLIADISLIPGVKARAAAAIIGEIGLDMSRFPTDGHILSWARLVPRLDETGGRIRSRRVKKGGAWLKPLLIQCAWAAARTNGTYLSAQFASIAARRGGKRAAMAVAGSILTAIYHMIKNGVPYRPPMLVPHSATDKTRQTKQHCASLTRLGYKVTLEAAA